ncbi:MFS transporter [Nonomuraea sp. NPDC049309]|uniref:MFS transporter n=1 Tax=Nonomuraea sp. NPDC049309 TaxID=3364350 RepID=UPI00372134CC
MSRIPQGGAWLLAYFLLSSVAEALQAVAVLWASYELTHNATVTGVVNAAAYVPGIVLGLVLRKRVDGGHASRQLALTNWALAGGSAALALVYAAGSSHDVVLGAFIVAQCVLSVVKALNKAYVGRVIRQRFPSPAGIRLREQVTSLGLVGGLVGGGAAGLVLETGAAGWCFGGAALLYVLSLASAWRVGSRPAAEERPSGEESPAEGRSAVEATAGADVKADPAPEPEQARGSGPEAEPGRGSDPAPDAGAAGRLRLILLYSVPSSGSLPFISTLTVPLAQAVAPGSSTLYSILTVASTCGGFLAGAALSSGRMSSRTFLNAALVAGGVLSAAVAATLWPPAVVLVMLVLNMVMTGHVMAMQVLTNQAPPEDQVGRFAVVRNAVAGTAKAGFSLLAGWLVEAAGLTVAWLFLAVVLGVFGAAWWTVRQRAAILRLVTVT